MVKQSETPVYTALQNYISKRIVSFDVPGHKQGKGHKGLVDAFGEKCVSMDMNSSKPLDNLAHPVGVIKEAEELMAEAFGASHAFLIVTGTSSAVQNMIFYSCRRGDKIIMPRNVHKSAINALVICGAVPIYVNPGVNAELGISLGMSVADVRKAIKENPDAKAIFVQNPTYYGVCSNLPAIVQMAHEAGMLVLVDEAHGTHLYFGENLPINGMKAGADMAAVSIHKTGGSLTQSSVLLTSDTVDADIMRQFINLTLTTSGSYLLMASLDIARRNLYENGREIFAKVCQMTSYARNEINKISGFHAFGEDIVNGDTVYAFDNTKLSIHTIGVGLAGIEVYNILRDEFDIQIEFGDIGNVLAIISVGDRTLELERLLGALAEIKRRFSKKPINMFDHEYINPIVVKTPQDAFYAKKSTVPLDETLDKICGELVMAYPPGIPIVAPGERITAEIIRYIKYAKEKGCFLTGTRDMDQKTIEIVEE